MNIQKLFIIILLSILLPGLTLSQETDKKLLQERSKGTPQNIEQKQQNKDDDAIIRVNTNIVQIDVTVTDAQGHQVTNLSSDDFEILEDNRSQSITNFSYISNQKENKTPIALKEPPIKEEIPPPQLKTTDVRRIVVLVVDDLGLSFESTNNIKDTLKKFITNKINAEDLVGIMLTSRRVNVLPQLTNDKRKLLASVDQISRSQFSRTGTNTIEAVNADNIPILSNDIQQNQVSCIETIKSLEQIVTNLEQLPGRKSMLLFSDGLRVTNDVIKETNRLAEQANKASTVIYTVDSRELQALNLSAEDELRPKMGPIPGGGSDDNTKRILNAGKARNQRSRDLENGMAFLANQTGGVFSRDLDKGISKILAEENGYYLIGYSPTEEEQLKTSGHQITIKVKNPALQVRYRKNYYGIKQEEDLNNVSVGERIITALNSPFTKTDISVRLTPLSTYDKADDNFLSTLLLINPQNLSFVTEKEDLIKTTFDIVTLTYDYSGQVVDQSSRTHSININNQTYQRMLKEGLAIYGKIPVKKPGVYQVRAVVIDKQSGRLGTDHRVVEVADIKKGKLALSTIFLTSPQQTETTLQQDENTQSDQLLISATRNFPKESLLQYAVNIYNSKLTDRLALKVRLFRNRQIVYDSKPIILDATKPENNAITSIGKLQLGRDLTPGEYVLQLVVSKDNNGKDTQTTSQISDFRIVE